jgi:hypothetical protein
LEIAKLESWLKTNFGKNTKSPIEYKAVWLKPAKRCVARLTQCITFLKHLYEIQRGYNFSGEGANPVDNGGADEPTCVSGSFNKLIAALSEVGHPGVQIIFITQALIIEQVPILTKQAFGDLSEIHQKKFAQGWEGENSETLQAECFDLLKHLVASKLHENYDEFNSEVPNLNQVIEQVTHNVEYTDMEGVIKKWLENNQKKEREKSTTWLDFSEPKTVTFSYKPGSHKRVQTTENNNDITPESRYPKRIRSFTGSYKGF